MIAPPNARALARHPGEPVTADDWNTLLDLLRARTPLSGVDRSDLSADAGHPWKVRVTLDTRDLSARSWRVQVTPGFANDELAAIPAELVAVTPVPGAAAAGPAAELFRPVSDSGRPVFFRTAERWTFDLYQASVLLTADTRGTVAIGGIIPDPARLVSTPPAHRVGLAGGAPTFAGLSRGSLELARLYLLRDPDHAPGRDQVLVRQACFWNVASALVYRTHLSADPGFDPLGTFLTGGGLLAAGPAAQQVVDDFAVVYWSL